MVNRIANDNSIQDLAGLKLRETQVEKTTNNKTGKSSTPSTVAALLWDQPEISNAAKQLAARDKEVSKFAQIAIKSKPPEQSDKVDYFKSLVNNGRVHHYLNKLDEDYLASLLIKEHPEALTVLSR